MEPGSDVPVAVVGMAVRCAGADTVEEFWRLLADGRTAVAEVPADRLPGYTADSEGVAAPHAGLLSRIDAFDAGFFGVSPRRAAATDPRQRLLLEASWHALEDAAIDPQTLAGTDAAVIVASTGSDFRQRMHGADLVDKYTAPGTLETFMANRISFQYDLRGGSFVLDTACSSGLMAVAQAVAGLSTGQYSTVLVGSAQVICDGFQHQSYVRAGLLSPTGETSPFCASANGYVRGEAAVMVVLRRLADAERDGDPIRAVIRGVAQSHDGRAGGPFAPDSQAQEQLIRRAAARAGLTPGDLGYVEAHAAGTQAGDTAEVNGLALALRGSSAAGGPAGRLWVGSLKGNVGHAEAAAGLLGLVKTVLVLERRFIPPIARFSAPIPELRTDGTPVAFATAGMPWPEPASGTRLAGVSSFGFGGANAHAVLTDYATPASPPATGPGRQLFPLAAATPTALRRLAGRFADWLVDRPEADLGQVAWTLQTGRAALPCRAILTGTDVGTLAQAADALGDLDGEVACPPGLDGAVLAAARSFLAGGPVDWPALWEGPADRRRAGLVPYPFEPESHWPPGEVAPAPLSRARQPRAHRPAPVPVPPVPARPQPAPGGSLRDTLCRLLSACLYQPPAQIGTDRDFVELGLDSVLLVEFIAVVNAELGTALTAKHLHQYRTVATLADFLDQSAMVARAARS